MYNEGISLSGDVLDTGVLYKIIQKRGTTYAFGEEKLGVGREAAKRYLKDNPTTMKKIGKQVMDAVEKGDLPEEEKDVQNDEAPLPTEE